MKRPDWWPKNPYPEDIFTGRRDEYVKLIPDEHTRTKVSGILGRVFWQIASDMIWDSMVASQEEDL
jgi:hypothetical protein